MADVILAGGAEAGISQLGLAGFAVMRALSTRNDDPQAASRPFDAQRDGFVPAEGSVVLVFGKFGPRPEAETPGSSPRWLVSDAPPMPHIRSNLRRAGPARRRLCDKRWPMPRCRWIRWTTSTPTALPRR